MSRPQKITFGEMRSTGTRGLIVFCSDYRRSLNVTLAPQWPDDVSYLILSRDLSVVSAGDVARISAGTIRQPGWAPVKTSAARSDLCPGKKAQREHESPRSRYGPALLPAQEGPRNAWPHVR